MEVDVSTCPRSSFLLFLVDGAKLVKGIDSVSNTVFQNVTLSSLKDWRVYCNPFLFFKVTVRLDYAVTYTMTKSVSLDVYTATGIKLKSISLWNGLYLLISMEFTS
jgi:hypothetical protein